MKISALDLFCGAGGLSAGLRRAGMSVAAAIDLDPACQAPIERNHGGTRFIREDVRELSVSKLRSLYPQDADVRVLAGCSPCQPFSKYTVRDGSDSRWSLVNSTVDLVAKLRPDIVVMENVPELYIRHRQMLEQQVERLEKLSYSTQVSIVDCRDYGVPQTRSRLVLLASRVGPAPTLEAPRIRRHRTVRDAISTLPEISAGEQPVGRDRLHVAPALSSANLKRIRATPEGGGWQDWPDSLRLACHKRTSGKYYGSVYGRMSWDEAAPTITTQCFGYGNGRFGHPRQARAISLREAALLQTFPRSYQFVNPGERVTFKHVGRLIGNAVPVALARHIGQAIIRSVS
jgi:DNA (cytosine-5)-methyltransferase 1